jgi:hypothetical protein
VGRATATARSTVATATGDVDLSDWVGKDIFTDKNVDLTDSIQIRGAIREIVLLIGFLSVYTMLTMRNAFNHQIFDYAQSVRMGYIQDELPGEYAPWGQDFNDIATIHEFYQWLHGPFAQKAFGPDEGQRYCRFIGSIRVSQLRSQKMACNQVPEEMKRTGQIDYCYNKGLSNTFLEANEDTSDFGNFSTFGPFKFNGINGDAGTYLGAHVEEDRQSGIFSQYLSAEMVVYPEPAFAVTIHPGVGLERGREIIDEIFESGYVDLQTKLIAVDASFYNPMLDRICTMRAVVELDDAGLVTSSSDIKVLRVWQSHTTDDRRYFILSVIVLVFYLYYMLQEVLEMYYSVGWEYWKSSLNIIQLSNIITYVAYNMLYMSMANYVPKNIDPDSAEYYNFQPAGRVYAVAATLEGITVVLNWFKAIPILSLSKTFMVFGITLQKSASHVSGFLVVFCMIMFGFTQAHVLMYGHRLKQFQTMASSFFSLIKALLGEFDFDALREANPYMGPAMFIVFIVLSVFVVLNMLIAIISDAYKEAKKETENKTDIDLIKLIMHYIHQSMLDLPVVGKYLARAEAKVVEVEHIMEEKIMHSIHRVHPDKHEERGELADTPDKATLAGAPPPPSMHRRFSAYGPLRRRFSAVATDRDTVAGDTTSTSIDSGDVTKMLVQAREQAQAQVQVQAQAQAKAEAAQQEVLLRIAGMEEVMTKTISEMRIASMSKVQAGEVVSTRSTREEGGEEAQQVHGISRSPQRLHPRSLSPISLVQESRPQSPNLLLRNRPQSARPAALAMRSNRLEYHAEQLCHGMSQALGSDAQSVQSLQVMLQQMFQQIAMEQEQESTQRAQMRQQMATEPGPETTQQAQMLQQVRSERLVEALPCFAPLSPSSRPFSQDDDILREPPFRPREPPSLAESAHALELINAKLDMLTANADMEL